MHNTYISIMVIKITGYALGLALGRCKVRGVSHGRLLELFGHEDLLILHDDLLVVLLLRGHVLDYLVIYMHENHSPG
jgi:hypothetical protein